LWTIKDNPAQANPIDDIFALEDVRIFKLIFIKIKTIPNHPNSPIIPISAQICKNVL